MKCYICENTEFNQVKGIVRDIPELKILKCIKCGLVTLENFDHIGKDYYESAKMNDCGSLHDYAESCIENDLWRVNQYKDKFKGKTVLDFGCGLGGFIKNMKEYCRIFGCDIDKSWQKVYPWLSINSSLEEFKEDFDVITMFHVLEHLSDPRKILKQVSRYLKDEGELIIEVPNADDALLTLYECEAFQNFTYWSCHLYLFTSHTLQKLIEQTGLKINYIKQVQRYPFANHLYWLAKGKPGGHKVWDYLNGEKLTKAYEANLAKLGKCDTIIASVKL